MNSLRTLLSSLASRFTLQRSEVRSQRSEVICHLSSVFCLLSSVVCLLLSGCQFYRAPVRSPDYYYVNPDRDLSAVGRVALVELDNDSSFPQISADVTKSLFQALQKKQVFGLTVVHQKDAAWHSLQFELDWGSQARNGARGPFGVPSTYTLEQLCAIRKTLKCDAVLIGTVTGYQPYPHMAIGLRLKLLDLKDAQLLWALEQIWDTADKTTEHRIKRYFNTQIRSGFAPLREQLVAVSPLRFVEFVAYEVAETLQPER